MIIQFPHEVQVQASPQSPSESFSLASPLCTESSLASCNCDDDHCNSVLDHLTRPTVTCTALRQRSGGFRLRLGPRCTIWISSSIQVSHHDGNDMARAQVLIIQVEIIWTCPSLGLQVSEIWKASAQAGTRITTWNPADCHIAISKPSYYYDTIICYYESVIVSLGETGCGL